MNYEKLYKEALERAREELGSGCFDRGTVEYIFPELKESDDERMVNFIKKQLFNIKKTITENYELDTKLTEAIDWLEKQCTVIKDAISMDVNSKTKWDDIHKFFRNNLDDKKAKLLIIKEE